jgi:type IV pilus assembly protein PilF
MIVGSFAKPATCLRTVFLISLVVLSGCVTEKFGDQPPEASMIEAADLNMQLGIGYLRQNDLIRAQEKLEKSVQQNPDLVMAQTILGLVYDRLGDEEAAEIAYRRAVAIEPKNPDALNSLAVYLCRTDATRPEALDLFDRALAVPMSKQFSNKAMLNTNAGMCAKTIDLPLAEDYLRAAIDDDPKFKAALVQLADVAYQRGNYLQSRAFLERYFSQTEASPTVLWLAVKVEDAMGDRQAANEFGRQLIRDFPESIEARKLLEQKRDAGT